MSKQMYKLTGKKSLFDEQFSAEKLSEIENPLDKIRNVVDFKMFILLLESKLINTTKKNNAGTKPFDVVLMFKILILQRYYGLGDKQIDVPNIGQNKF